ncbi:hypothetical protein BDP27DRAFT_1440479 [Rhodocollybia butyracea]|uniref:Uncharacterized protein n=1 Tax=Rhodocollybia butyracea TaxID=206335 RepID=A0A9P5TVE3_9AGAR|nr:hypothetical protein BDP27DRAFT_1440479 [Rhodocollybia butyracea]
MLLTHHWLGFVLLAVLIFPACAAPPLARRDITLAHRRIEGFLGVPDVGINLKDGPGYKKITHLSLAMGLATAQLIKTEMLYFKLTGGNSCAKICYGYVVSNSEGNRDMTISALITSRDEQGQYRVVRKPLPDSRKDTATWKQTRAQQHLKFLKEFVPTKRRVVAMAMAEYSAAPEFEGVREAAEAIEEADQALYAEVVKQAVAKGRAREDAKWAPWRIENLRA